MNIKEVEKRARGLLADIGRECDRAEEILLSVLSTLEGRL